MGCLSFSFVTLCYLVLWYWYQVVAATTMEVSCTSSSFSSSCIMQGVTSNCILSSAGSDICGSSPALEPLVKGTTSLKGDGAVEQGSCSTVSDISSTCNGRRLYGHFYYVYTVSVISFPKMSPQSFPPLLYAVFQSCSEVPLQMSPPFLPLIQPSVHSADP